MINIPYFVSAFVIADVCLTKSSVNVLSFRNTYGYWNFLLNLSSNCLIEDNKLVNKFNKFSFVGDFLGHDPDKPSKKRFWELFITNNPDAQYETEEDETEEKETEEETEEEENEEEILAYNSIIH